MKERCQSFIDQLNDKIVQKAQFIFEIAHLRVGWKKA